MKMASLLPCFKKKIFLFFAAFVNSHASKDLKIVGRIEAKLACNLYATDMKQSNFNVINGENLTWSIIGISPIARARRKQPGTTCSCPREREMMSDRSLHDAQIFKLCIHHIPASGQGHPWGHYPHTVCVE
jgi:hypothetical protein